ncbi:MAG TPA: hypothetical protein VHO94_04020 [Oscillospiraceae bacterium]|nr:hypothetical protein [Oscillospiraceae bacterium]
MISTSEQYKLNIYTETVQKSHAKGTIKFSDGSTYPLQDSDFWDSSVKIEDGTSRPETLAVGEAAVNKLTVTLQNFDRRFDNYDFTDAEIQISTGMKLPDDTIEWLNKGTFTVDEPVTASEIMIISLADDMTKFDRKYDSPLSYPNTLGNILDDACTRCGVLLETQTFLNSNYVVSTRPADDATTYRDIVSYVAQLTGCWARINNLRKLVLGWYDLDRFYPQSGKIISGGTFKDYSPTKIISGGTFKDFHPTKILSGGVFRKNLPTPPMLSFLNNPVIATEDVKITGVQVTPNDDKKQAYISGTTGYVVNIQKNPLAQDNIDILAASIGNRLIGFRFRPMNVSALDDPSIEAGDVVYVNGYKTIISNLTYSMGSFETFSADAETKAERNSVKFSQGAKIAQEAKQETIKQLSEYDLQVQQLSNLMANSFGLFTTDVKLPDNSVIHYMHDRPALADSQTVWKKTADAFAVSTDGGKNWNAGLTATGDAVVNILSAKGINADWMRVGKLLSKNGKVYLDLDNSVGAFNKLISTETGAENMNLNIGIYTFAGGSTANGLFLQDKDDTIITMTETPIGGNGSKGLDFANPGDMSIRANANSKSLPSAKAENGIYMSEDTLGNGSIIIKRGRGSDATYILQSDKDIGKLVQDFSTDYSNFGQLYFNSYQTKLERTFSSINSSCMMLEDNKIEFGVGQYLKMSIENDGIHCHVHASDGASGNIPPTATLMVVDGIITGWTP